MVYQRGDKTLRFHPYFDICHNSDDRFVSSTRRLKFRTKQIPWYLYILEAESNPWLLNMYYRMRLLEHFQGPQRKLNPRPPSFDAAPKPTVPQLSPVPVVKNVIPDP